MQSMYGLPTTPRLVATLNSFISGGWSWTTFTPHLDTLRIPAKHGWSWKRNICQQQHRDFWIPEWTSPPKERDTLELLLARAPANLSLPQTERERGREHTNSRLVRLNTPLVFSTSGGMVKSTSVAYKQLASLLARKWDQPYSLVIAWLRCHVTFSLLRSAITCLRGARSSSGPATHNGPVDLVVSEGQVPFEKLWTKSSF